MDGRQRVIRALTFDRPDRIPVDTWCMGSAYLKYGKPLEDAVARYATDFFTPQFVNHVLGDERGEPGVYTDGWGCVWHNLKRGIIGEVKEHPLADYGRLDGYRAPLAQLERGWDDVDSSIAHNRDRFVLTPWSIDLFERMQHLRGTERLLMDLMEEPPELFRLRDLVMEFYRRWLELWLRRDVDGVLFSDDWGAQNALLVPPRVFREFFKPLYRELIATAKAAGKYVFFHSDGDIHEIYGDLVELGVDAINSQLWCMDVEVIARQYRGKLAFWGEISRQTTLPFGTPEDVYAAADRMKALFLHNGGGLIGCAAPGDDCPLENIVASLACWNP